MSNKELGHSGWRVDASRCVAAIALMLFAGSVLASSTLLLNGSPARQCYLAAREPVDADMIETCTLAIQEQMLTPTDLAATYSNRGILLARAGRLRAALKDHNRAVRLAPETTSIYINRSNALLAAKRFAEALADLETAIARQDELLPVAYYNRALMFNSLGDHESARADAERAASLAPESEAYRRFARNLGH